MASVTIAVIEQDGWKKISIKGRVDAFSDRRIFDALQKSAPLGELCAVDLSECPFASIWFLKAMVDWSRLQKQAGGEFVTLSPSDTVRRQMEVFLGEGLQIFGDWQSMAIETHFNREQKQISFSQSKAAPLVFGGIFDF